MVTVKVSETYDLSTQVDKCGMIAVHTPSWATVRSLWRGLGDNHRFARLDACDITMACASVLPADPTQIGTEAGDIAPQDMFNPILYKAVSNESFNNVLNRMYNINPVLTDAGGAIGSINKTNDLFNDIVDDDNSLTYDDWDYYYGLLADSDGWKKAMPQSGLEMRGLYPMVYSLLSNYGNEYPPQTTVSNINKVNVVEQNGTAGAQSKAAFFRGPPMKMPRFPLHYLNVEDHGGNPQIPQTYVACIITPPAKLNKFYFRMRVTWYVTFEEVVPLTDWMHAIQLGLVGSTHYGTDYAMQSKAMTNTTNLVDTKDTDITLVNTSGK